MLCLYVVLLWIALWLTNYAILGVLMKGNGDVGDEIEERIRHIRDNYWSIPKLFLIAPLITGAVAAGAIKGLYERWRQ
jgi:hypothetical protein